MDLARPRSGPYPRKDGQNSYALLQTSTGPPPSAIEPCPHPLPGLGLVPCPVSGDLISYPMMNITQIEAEALSLPVDARASLAQRLLLSLEEISEPEFDCLWGEESARRAAEVDAGIAQSVPGDEVATKARALLR